MLHVLFILSKTVDFRSRRTLSNRITKSLFQTIIKKQDDSPINKLYNAGKEMGDGEWNLFDLMMQSDLQWLRNR